jgi:ubiquinone/menaquinone biosynthesis C-methylase UbiE
MTYATYDHRFAAPELLLSHFHVRDGDLVGDFGAGAGTFIPGLSKKVGERGRVFACEIQRGLVEKIGSMINEANLRNVDPLWCDLETENGIKISDSVLDVAIVINTLHQLENHEQAIAEKRRTMREGGVVYVVDWHESFGGIGPHPDCVICKQLAIDLFEAAGFILEREYPAGVHHYGLAFRVI